MTDLNTLQARVDALEGKINNLITALNITGVIIPTLDTTGRWTQAAFVTAIVSLMNPLAGAAVSVGSTAWAEGTYDEPYVPPTFSSDPRTMVKRLGEIGLYLEDKVLSGVRDGADGVDMFKLNSETNVFKKLLDSENINIEDLDNIRDFITENPNFLEKCNLGQLPSLSLQQEISTLISNLEHEFANPGIFSIFGPAINSSSNPSEILAMLPLISTNQFQQLSRLNWLKGNIPSAHWGNQGRLDGENLKNLLLNPYLMNTFLEGIPPEASGGIDPDFGFDETSQQFELSTAILENPKIIDEITKSPVIGNLLLDLVNSPVLRDLIAAEIAENLLSKDVGGNLKGELLSEINHIIDTKLREAGLVPFTLTIGWSPSTGLTWSQADLGDNGDGNSATPPKSGIPDAR